MSSSGSQLIAHRSADANAFRLVYGVLYVGCLLGALVERAAPWRWGRKTGTDGAPQRSVFADARSAARIAAGFAFMH